MTPADSAPCRSSPSRYTDSSSGRPPDERQEPRDESRRIGRKQAAAIGVVGLAITLLGIAGPLYFVTDAGEGCGVLEPTVSAEQTERSHVGADGSRERLTAVTFRYCGEAGPMLVLRNRTGVATPALAMGVNESGARLDPQWNSAVDSYQGGGEFSEAAIADPGETMTVSLFVGGRHGEQKYYPYANNGREVDENDCAPSFEGENRTYPIRGCRSSFGAAEPLESGDVIEVYRAECATECTYLAPVERLLRYRVE